MNFRLAIAALGGGRLGERGEHRVDERLNAEALVRRLTSSELEALRNVAGGGSVRELASSLSTDIAEATEITESMKMKLGAVRAADAVRVALYAGIC